MNHSIWDAVSIFMAVVFGCVVLLLSIVIWSIRRHRDPKLHIECSSPIDELIPDSAVETQGDIRTVIVIVIQLFIHGNSNCAAVETSESC